MVPVVVSFAFFVPVAAYANYLGDLPQAANDLWCRMKDTTNRRSDSSGSADSKITTSSHVTSPPINRRSRLRRAGTENDVERGSFESY